MRRILGFSYGIRKFNVLQEPFPANRENKVCSVPAIPPGMNTKNSSQQPVTLWTKAGLMIVFHIGLYPTCLIVV